jgi:Ran GTPase-activating protein (RanGAP) involved in mRNA processing and transport
MLLPIFKTNIYIETLNVADTTIDGDCTMKLCQILKEQSSTLRLLKFRNSNLGEVGAQAISNLIGGHQTLVELEIFNCGISEKGGNAIGNALKTNFCIEKLCIGGNILAQSDVEQI